MKTQHEARVAKCLDAMLKLNGLPPYNDWGNHCYGDGYFANSIERDFTALQIHQASIKLEMLERLWKDVQAAFVERVEKETKP